MAAQHERRVSNCASRQAQLPRTGADADAAPPPRACADPNVYPSGKARPRCAAARPCCLCSAAFVSAPHAARPLRAAASRCRVPPAGLPGACFSPRAASKRQPADGCARALACLPASLQSILNDEKGWKPSVTVKQILTGIQELLDSPNNKDAAQEPAWRLFDKDQAKYILRVKEEVRKYTPVAGADVVL